MSAHQQEHLDLLFLFALQALPARETATVESQIAACGECRQALDSLGPIVRFRGMADPRIASDRAAVGLNRGANCQRDW
jgi:hypothetical protein